MTTDHLIDKPNNYQTLELLEERAHINKDRVSTGKVVLSKQTRSRTVNLPITLTEEYLVITYKEDNSLLNHQPNNNDASINVIDNTTNSHTQISINDQMHSLTLDTPVEILLSRETAIVTKSTHSIEEVRLDTKTISKEHIFTTELKKEVLDIKGDEALIAKETPSLNEK
ncbi:YsnF/AvaK domain-containing protein [Moraxella oculi]|uniref:YsnF/AvaK domain-containing protein n=1 Tax=Moraxella oculi TaxID=2940516 RepID=A0ABW8U8D4_9GAMM